MAQCISGFVVTEEPSSRAHILRRVAAAVARCCFSAVASGCFIVIFIFLGGVVAIFARHAFLENQLFLVPISMTLTKDRVIGLIGGAMAMLMGAAMVLWL
ncbi:hypothetical protein LYZ90_18520 [Xanthomonas hortorum pv. vitians]|uniref:hypothetical protein n=1 Tax=Xanthomonas hortorum TaxID=56454 RepID=UPI001F2656DF|nr:hypothetical protein [Xanthomonas hortorum]MCE4312787.1 hypothetical protein [Xanthomonas hortorum pv. vitians]MCE4535384.1 hypothetical protein [Xanthomonas hortorum pv. vitians]